MNEPVNIADIARTTLHPSAPRSPFGSRPSADTDVEEMLATNRRRAWEAIRPSRFAGAHIDDVADHVRDDLVAWCEQRATTNVLLLGPVGVGKTFAALAAARDRHAEGDTVAFWPVVELLDALRPSANVARSPADHDDVAGAYTVGVLVLDDLGAERPTEWTAERLYALINRRWLEERPTIVTSNLAPDVLREAIGERMYSRIADGAVGLHLVGPDRRAS